MPGGVILVVDMAQGLGVVPLDPEKARVSAMAGSAWKWLMGPVGLGIFFCHPSLMDRLPLTFVGTNTVVNATKYLNYDFTPKADASRFEFSTPNFNDWLYFLTSLKLLQEIGFQNVRERIFFLTSYLREGLIRKGFRIPGSIRPEAQSGIVAFGRKGFNVKEAVHRLADRNIVVAERNGFIRVSPHIYNNEEDLDCLLKAL